MPDGKGTPLQINLLRGIKGMAETFTDERYRTRAAHIARMQRFLFESTEADVTYNRFRNKDPSIESRTINMSFGDPSVYPGLGPYEGVHRFIRRFMNFEPPSAYSRYNFRGDPALLEQLRIGSYRTAADSREDYIRVPDHVRVYLAPGVAGALRLVCPAIILPPSNPDEVDNVIVPKWTYLSHMAEIAFAQGEVRSCDLDRSGRVDLKDMERMIDHNTRAVMLATAGNPLGTAIEHERYEDMLRLVHAKMMEYKQPIVVIADVIYEHFRRESNGRRLDAIQKALSMFAREGIDVPTIETSSFSKMFAMAGQRFGFHRDLLTSQRDLSMAIFQERLEDMMRAMEIVYGTTLNPVSNLLQRPVGKLYHYINLGLPNEEELAPVAAILTALKQLTDMRGKGETHTLMAERAAEEVIRALGADPEAWFTTSAISKRTRKIAKAELGKYGVDLDSGLVEEVGKKLRKAGMIEAREIEISKTDMDSILLAAVTKHCGAEEKILAGLQEGMGAAGLDAANEHLKAIAEAVLAQLTKTKPPSGDRLVEELGEELGISEVSGGETDAEVVKLRFFRLKPDAKVPQLEMRKSGEIKIYGAAETFEWKEIAQRCGVSTENVLYEDFKKERRREVWERVDMFVDAIEEMRKQGLGVYLHPAHYDENGNLARDRINSLYVLFGFEDLKQSECQASELISLCVALGASADSKIVKATPGEIFLPPDLREAEESSYIRAVPLFKTDGGEEVLTTEQMDELIKAIRRVAEYLQLRRPSLNPA